MTYSQTFLGIFEGHWNPSVAVVRDGKIIAYAEEERFIRMKHAHKIYPIRALKYCLDQAGVKTEEIEAIGINWDLPAYTNGNIKAFFTEMSEKWILDENTLKWQHDVLSYFNMQKTQQRHESEWRRAFGKITLPPLHPIPHHFVHALHAFFQSPFKDALCITIDGSGDQYCTVLWHCQNEIIRPIRSICMPHSLGWFYAAFTEYIGFQAYDGEYKLMGLAAYGHHNIEMQNKVKKVLSVADDGVEYRLNPSYIHYGSHSWSDRFTDQLIELFEHPKRLPDEPILDWHQDLAFTVQHELEEAVYRLVEWGIGESKTHNLCIGGGVGLNVKMNSKLFSLNCVHDMFAQPLCDDGGAAAGVALGAYWRITGKRPETLTTLALGPEESDEAIQHVLDVCLIPYIKVDDIAEAVADELVLGRIVGWFQGRMEAGPRALGQRSILADPRDINVRDRVNGAVKFREFWRPFCPSMPYEYAKEYFKNYTNSPFMNVAFDASEKLIKDAPAIVHVDGTARVQLVHQEFHPLFHRLLKTFEHKTGIPVLLNTSFNLKGEPIVCNFSDALRTFFSSGMGVLAAGNFLIKKEGI
jgi:carbamoyltransferase